MAVSRTVVSAEFEGSARHRDRASRTLARGVSSSPRAGQLPVPLVIAEGKGARIRDVDGNEYVDFSMGYGPLILGHTPPAVIEAVSRAMSRGLRVGSVHEDEAELAELIAELVPSAQVTTFVSSGTEAVALALRIARAGTSRNKVVKFRCHYHGWSDGIHVATAAGADGPGTVGQDPDAARNVIVLDWGDLAALDAALDESVAAVVMEAAPVNAGCFAPPAGFLEQVRAATRRHGALLVFDEVITGFRVALGGAQQRYGVEPDLTVLGKALGAGLPISAVTGTSSAMDPVVSGELLHRGTYNGNPVSVAAAIATLRQLAAEADTVYPRMESQALTIASHVATVADESGVSLTARAIGSCLQVFVGDVPDLRSLGNVDRAATLRLTSAMVRHGLVPLPRGLMYLSTVHSDRDVDQTLHGITRAIADFAEKDH